MKENLETLIKRFESGERLKFVFFWGHSNNTNAINKSCFSQWYMADFEVEGVVYKTAEHWMMAKKAELFNDTETLEKIINSEKPGEAKALGRKVRDFDHQVWKDNKYDIVVAGNVYKFKQNQALQDFLVNTKQRILVESSPVDTIWGIGMSQDDPDVENPLLWRGQNLLGFALMEVRGILCSKNK